MKDETVYYNYADCVDFKHKLAEKIEDGVWVISYKVWRTNITNGGHLAVFSSTTKPTDRQLRKWKKKVYKV